MLRLRRIIASTLCLGYMLASGEAVAGFVRDGAVHHESSVVAAVHQEARSAEHGHEDGGLGSEHGSEHQHGTSSDHCTHTHSVGIPAAYDFGVFIGPAVVDQFTQAQPASMWPGSYFRPPKA